MDNRIIHIVKNEKRKTDMERQTEFTKLLDSKPREEAKKLLMKHTDNAIQAIAEFKADLIVNKIHCNIFDFTFNDTKTIFKPLFDSIKCMDFVITKEGKRLINTAGKNWRDRQEADEAKRKTIKEVDEEYNTRIKEIRTKNGTIKLKFKDKLFKNRKE